MNMLTLRPRGIRLALACSAAAVALSWGYPAAAQAPVDSDVIDFDILRYAQEITDGSQVVSQSKDIVIGRADAAGATRAVYDIQNGALTIEHDGGTSVINLLSRVSAEGHFALERSSGLLAGSDPWTVAAFNTLEPPTSPGSANWQQPLPLARLMVRDSTSHLSLELSRTIVTIAGVETALIQFEAPAFTYDLANGAPVVHWARGFAVVDRKTNEIYALATQHRASIVEAEGMRPVAIRTTLHGIRADGAWEMKFEDVPAVEVAVKRLNEVAGDATHTLDGAEADTATAFVVGVASRLDRFAMLLLADPANSPAWALAAADSGAAFVGQVPVDARVTAPELPTADQMEAAMRRPGGDAAAAYAGAGELGLSITTYAPPWIYSRPPLSLPAASMEGGESLQAGPLEESPSPQLPSDLNAALLRAQAEIRRQQEMAATIADAQRQIRDAQSTGRAFPQEIIDKLDRMLGKDRPNDLNAALRQVQEEMRRVRDGGGSGNSREFPQEILDKLDALLGKTKPMDFNTAIREVQDEMRRAQQSGRNVPQEIIDKLDALLGKNKPRKEEFPQEILDKLDALLGKDKARLVDLPLEPGADLSGEYLELFAAMEAEMAYALQDVMDDLLAGDWSESELVVLDDFFRNNAFDYTSMVGIVATDLSRWAEWLATQNVRELERLAKLAGYPNLASALADAQNILRQSQDPGYRQWALQAPSCNGPAGCGPSYLERWHMKQSIVALGDILADSRDIFSTGGFSDIGISGLDLSYLLRDHALEDGDIVRVRISQFGHVIYEGTVNLTNAGEVFGMLLGRGVASLEIFAVNEGSASPNTAQITVDKVVRGQATQTYSLNTGQTATLRIEAGAKPAPAAGTSGAPQ